ncbi:MAG: hypothetical protein KF819_14125 [Labilithrix sp.]|nr:hypothetical protein [Labilithrix sp.]
MLARPLHLSVVCGTLALAACGPGAPTPAATTPSKPIVSASPPAPVDVTAVPEPEGLLMVGRVAKPEAILKTVGVWTRLPLPGGADLVRSITDDAVADAVDLSQPVDGGVTLGGSKHSPRILTAVSVAVRSYEDAKAKLGAKHKLTPGKNGQLTVEGVGRAAVTNERERGRARDHDDDDDDEPETCLLAPAPAAAKGSDGRLVCGEREALDALVPYLTRTVSRQTWSSDVHVEMRLQPAKAPLSQARAALPVLAGSLLGSSPALRGLIDASVSELFDVVNDTQRIYLDAELADSGATATMKIDYASAQSLLARFSTSNADRAGAPPPAFWHLPAETDLALFGRGSDPKLFDRPRELLGKVALETTEGMGMPDPERKAVRELVVDRIMGLFTGPLVYGKGYDAAALDRALAARKAAKPGDTAAADEAERIAAEQMIGWHLVQVGDPITKVGPILKDWAQLWNRPAFAKWAKEQASAKMLAQMRTSPPPAGVTLPKDTVHLEIVLPRPDIEELVAPPSPPSDPRKPAPPGAPPKPKVKKIPRKPVVLHVFAVPDQGGTWLAFGLDGKLVARNVAASLSTAPEKDTLGKSQGAEALRDAKANAAWLATIRGLAVFTALEHGSRSPYALLGTLQHKGATPIVLTFAAEGPSASAAGGSARATFRLPRAAIEDLVKGVMSGAR